ncbi:hypothetical protein [Elizabethkingia sp. M8]|uniref:DUF6965 family protein n=1 Tax=Elizabethkingia sp. M8 TaxID=2796140 RepID=UPI00190850F2|nr:hypothetical protein [Elizabethkingia sp. M8]QQM28082.1 hypothetical protein JCR23_06585 [Elizabethkingia sp. M8]
MKIDEVTNISNCELFIKNHLSTIKANNGNENYSAYLTRMQKLKALLENSSKENV